MRVDALKPLLAAAAALVLALPAWAQDAEDPAVTEASGEASGEAGPPENAGEEPAAAGETEDEQPAAGEGNAEPAGEEAAGEGAEAVEAVEAAIEQAAGEAAENAGEDTADGPVVVDIEEGTVIDDQTFEGEDDDFIPSEEIPIDQAIPFPTDI